MLDDAKPARADKNKKKYSISLEDFEKQLWVGNSEQIELRALQLQEWIHQPSGKDLAAMRYVLIWESTAKSPGFLWERKRQGLHCWAKLA